MSNTENKGQDTKIWGLKINRTMRFMRLGWLTISFSVLIILSGAVKYFMQGGFKLGIDFIGGTRVEAHINKEVKIDDLRQIFSASKMDAEVTTVGSGTNLNFLITLSGHQTGDMDSVKMITETLEKQYSPEAVVIRGSELIGSRMGNTFAQRSLQLMIIVIVMILIYVAVRFDFFYGAGAIVALLHDILIMLVAVVFFDIRLDVTILAAILTILGYSINDTIVVFDRVRENHKINSDEDFRYTMNKSISQTLSRTLITSFTTLIVAVAIFLLGGRVLRDFGLSLIVGIISGTYSSVFIASPITFMLKQKFDKSAHTQAKKKKSSDKDLVKA